MKTGDILLVPFPFAEHLSRKVRPYVFICQTKDKFQDVVIAAISSIIPDVLNENDIIIKYNNINKLRKDSIIKVDRIATIKEGDIIFYLGKLSPKELNEFKLKFKALVE